MPVYRPVHRIEQHQGLGDAVALTAVLRHLRAREPDCRIELIVDPGRASLYAGLADEVSTESDPRRPPTHLIQWPLPTRSYAGHPSTYVERCLIEQFGIRPIPDLCRYQVTIAEAARARARAWLDKESPKSKAQSPKFALCHFRGASMKEKKNVGDYEAAAIAGVLDQAGYRVLIFDAADPTRLTEQGLATRVPNGPPLFPILATDDKPAWRRPIDAAILGGLLLEVDLFVGVDSGPLHLASAVGARAVGLWTKQSPLHCICHDDLTLHLCQKGDAPEYERSRIHGPIDDGLNFFRAHYKHVWCDDFSTALAALL